jgi:hypothetical protein
MIFDYPTEPHVRQHGPSGYRTYQSYKIWLRDEFQFRCVFCLVRERWYANGDAAFSVEHLKPRDLDPTGLLDYDNLYYSCLTCNSVKRAVWPLADPCKEAFASHLRVLSDGHVQPLSRNGQVLWRTLQLDEPLRVEFRLRMLRLYAHLESQMADPGAKHLFKSHFGFPDDLPDLRTARVSRNRRPNGVHNSHFVRRERGSLPETY